MANQLRAVADLPGNVAVHVIPLRSHYPLGSNIGPFVLLDFDTAEPSTVYAEAYGSALYYEESEIVQRYRDAYSSLEHVALSQADSKMLIRKIAREYDGEWRPNGGEVVQKHPQR
ncbi:hypothetical protein GCM10023318_50110 [Nocardia callitridis]|uniref:DUF5753 domain-containing protein n=1 Tax=Nocardia callitridis TaxID=648753 RepID=A0ABP9KRG2_9NOCA